MSIFALSACGTTYTRQELYEQLCVAEAGRPVSDSLLRAWSADPVQVQAVIHAQYGQWQLNSARVALSRAQDRFRQGNFTPGDTIPAMDVPFGGNYRQPLSDTAKAKH